MAALLEADDDQPVFAVHRTVRLADEHVWEEWDYRELDRWGDCRHRPYRTRPELRPN